MLSETECRINDFRCLLVNCVMYDHVAEKAPLGPLNDEMIIQAAKDHITEHGKPPSTGDNNPIPSLPGWTWRKISKAFYYHREGLDTTASGLNEFLRKHGLKERKDDADYRWVTEDAVLDLCKAFYDAHGVYPTAGSTQLVPDHPETSWRNINCALEARGLLSISKLLDDRGLKVKVMPGGQRQHLFTDDEVVELAKAHKDKHGKYPTLRSLEPIEGYPKLTWMNLNQRLLKRPESKSLNDVMVQNELFDEIPGVTEEEIVGWIKSFKDLHGHIPAATESSRIPEYPHLTWQSLNVWLRKGEHGLTPGTSVHKLAIKHRISSYSLLKLALKMAFSTY